MRREAIERKMAAVEVGIANLRDAMRHGKATEMLLEGLEAEGRRRDTLRGELTALERRAEVNLEDGELQTALRASLADLESFLGRHVAQTRQVLRKLLVGRLACFPFAEGARRGYRFTGQGSYDRLVPDRLSRPYVVTPAGTTTLGLRPVGGLVLVA